MTNFKLARAISIALTGLGMVSGSITDASAASTTMYNLFHEQAGNAPCSPCSTGQTDGWVWGGVGVSNPTFLNEPYDIGNPPGPALPGFIGIGGSSTPTSATPFGYYGDAVVNWALEFTGGKGGMAEISNADSRKYGHSADIDVAKGAWSDNGQGGAGGWAHDLDFGLFRSDSSGLVSLKITGVTNVGNDQFGFTIMKGMDTNPNYNHHASWNRNTNGTRTPCEFGGCSLTAADIVASSIGDPDGAGPLFASNIGGIQFFAEAGQIYTIALGGYRTGHWGNTVDGYKLSVTQVPVPAAFWLLGSALAGLVGLTRRQTVNLG